MGHICRLSLALGTALFGAGCGFLTGIEPLSTPDCSDAELGLSNPVYVVGSDSILPVLEEVGPTLSDSLQVIYVRQPSCTGVKMMIHGDFIEDQLMTFWGPGGKPPGQCHVLKELPDIGVSDVFPETCKPYLDIGDEMIDLAGRHLEDVKGPIQTAFFTAPANGNSVTSIDGTQAKNIFDQRETSHDEPWTDDDFVFRRNEESGTQNLIGAVIGVKSKNFRGTIFSSAGELIDAIDGTEKTDAQKTIGMFDVPSDSKKGNHKRLGYNGVWPSVEKEGNALENVRNGSYELWGPLHMIVQDDRDTHVSEVVNRVATDGKLLDGEAGKELVRKIIRAQLVPACAMKKKRILDKDGGDVIDFRHDYPCRCFYDSMVTQPSCQECGGVDDPPCEMEHRCYYGYCESDFP